MVTPYKDRNEIIVKVGDILYYDEGKGYAKGIHEVVKIGNNFFGKTHHFNNLMEKWETSTVDDIIDLAHYTTMSKGDVLNDAEVIGNIFNNPEMLLLDWAEKNKPIDL